MAHAQTDGLTHSYKEHLDGLKRDLEAATVAFDIESAEVRAANGNAAVARPKAEAYGLALLRYRKFLLDGIVAPDGADS
jgi:hypothetical protein